jgi:hypothetical protein
VTAYEKVQSGATISSTSVQTINANCPSSKRVLGGGYLSTQSNGSNSSVLVVLSSGPNSTNTGWQVAARINSSNNSPSFAVTAYALCANVSLQ